MGYYSVDKQSSIQWAVDVPLRVIKALCVRFTNAIISYSGKDILFRYRVLRIRLITSTGVILKGDICLGLAGRVEITATNL